MISSIIPPPVLQHFTQSILQLNFTPCSPLFLHWEYVGLQLSKASCSTQGLVCSWEVGSSMSPSASDQRLQQIHYQLHQCAAGISCGDRPDFLLGCCLAIRRRITVQSILGSMASSGGVEVRDWPQLHGTPGPLTGFALAYPLGSQGKTGSVSRHPFLNTLPVRWR